METLFHRDGQITLALALAARLVEYTAYEYLALAEGSGRLVAVISSNIDDAVFVSR